jgi:predicted transcriptional regulator
VSTRTLGVWWHERARALAAEGKSHPEIAVLFGVTKSAVWKACHPERIAELSRIDNARRRQQKREWEREHYRGECEVCGARTGKRSCTRCPKHSLAREAHRQRREEIQRRWLAGESLNEIAAALGTTKNSAQVTVHRMRREGWDMPYRYKIVDGKRVAA